MHWVNSSVRPVMEYVSTGLSVPRQHLVRRIGWRLQVLAQGDLPERAVRLRRNWQRMRT
jgi:hypothetical protein